MGNRAATDLSIGIFFTKIYGEKDGDTPRIPKLGFSKFTNIKNSSEIFKFGGVRPCHGRWGDRHLQEWIIERRRQQQSNAAECSSRELVQTAEDLAAKLCAFASDGIVVKHLVEFALPSKKRANAVEVTPKVASVSSDNQCQAISNATEYAAKEKKGLKKQDDSHKRDTHHVILSRHTAQAMAENFFKFVQQEHLQEHLNPMSGGQILVLCIFHSRLLWQKGKPIELKDIDQYWIPKPVYTPASAVNAPSPPHFVQKLQADATERSRPQIQPPRVCCLCGKGFIDAPALWRHCESEHHSWAEARKRMLWEAEKLESIPLLPSDKRRLVQNFAADLSYCRPAEGHFGRDKVCMRQLVGCATCARVDWIATFFPCFLFKDCPDSLLPKPDDTDDEESEANISSDEEASAKEQRGGKLLKDEDGYYVADPHKIHQLLDVSKYIEAWPLIPIEELHASSVQHPTYPQYRWLLNTRRVPAKESENATRACHTPT